MVDQQYSPIPSDLNGMVIATGFEHGVVLIGVTVIDDVAVLA